MADSLPPIPPVPALDDPLFLSKMAVRNSIQALYRDAAINDQTAQMATNAAEVRASTAALQAATAATMTPETDAELWVRFMAAQFANDTHGTVRLTQGVGNMAEWASQAVAKFREKYPAA